MINKEQKYIDDLFEINEELKQAKEQHKEAIKKKDDLLDEALFLVASHIGFTPKSDIICEDQAKRAIKKVSFVFLYKLFGKKIEKGTENEFVKFIQKKQMEHIEKDVLRILAEK